MGESGGQYSLAFAWNDNGQYINPINDVEWRQWDFSGLDPVGLLYVGDQHIPAALRTVLLGEATFYNVETGEYCYADALPFSDDVPVKVSRFAEVDMDNDAIPEVVLWLERGGNESVMGSIILHYQNGWVYGYPMGYRSLELETLKADGTYSWSGGAFHWGWGRMDFATGKTRDISSGSKRREYWKGIQAIFQDPFASFNTFNKIDTVLLDCINMRGGKNLSKQEKFDMMTEACSFVNLKFAELTNKYPFELSGGQMQRLMIARIFLLKPKILLADEPTSMVDACSRATILDMLLQLRDEVGMTVIFITHDIGLAYYISDTVYIMEHGKFVEYGKADEVILNPKAAYTKRLISDVPKIHEEWDLSTVDELNAG